MAHNRPTINDVAEAAGVSKGTVSRVINGHNWVSPPARAAVLAAIERLGFVPNRSAQNLAFARSNCVACVLSEPIGVLAENTVFTTRLEEVTKQLTVRGKSAVLMFADQDEQRAHVVRHAQARHVDGAILMSADPDDPLIPLLTEGDVPLVTAGRLFDEPRPGLPHVTVDDRMGATQAVEHLLGLGRERIGVIAGPLVSAGARARLDAARGLLDGPDRVAVAGAFTQADGYAACRDLLERFPEVDGLFVAADVLAIGAVRCLHELGRIIPDDLAVVGFDDIPAVAALHPPLTTIAPGPGGAEALVETILARIDGRDMPSVDVPTRLVRRASA
ncbi:LacI family transcriptional regulator [Nonomuraea turkmeniaca]|uniref:LacI family transcriptional regulator n=1 Tax=Nonomuraea turkmeniaca TaxID=103838 RepID=A0A5S4FVJ6_9ACTN|nr:LacI family DNA-binding transcriptional regulator [Nonomuraea turkmeniaca]TMR24796.1 LacI family transcriptional regulator [Nonomuraea turkmeniaca]